MTTLLKRATGSALDVFIERDVPPNTITLLSPHTQRIRYLTFPCNSRREVLSEVFSGPLPLLRRLLILEPDDPHNQPNVFVAPPLPLFGGAINLEEFVFGQGWDVPLNNFVFPNLTTFELYTPPRVESDASVFLNFLEASPTLQTIEVDICGAFVLENVPRGIVVLPNVKTFSLSVEAICL